MLLEQRLKPVGLIQRDLADAMHSLTGFQLLVGLNVTLTFKPNAIKGTCGGIVFQQPFPGPSAWC